AREPARAPVAPAYDRTDEHHEEDEDEQRGEGSRAGMPDRLGEAVREQRQEERTGREGEHGAQHEGREVDAGGARDQVHGREGRDRDEAPRDDGPHGATREPRAHGMERPAEEPADAPPRERSAEAVGGERPRD